MIQKLRLLRADRHASWQSMRGRLLRLFLILGVLFAGAGLPALAHVHEGGTSHAMEVLDQHHDDAHAADEQDETSRDEPEQVNHHHHCFSSTAAVAPSICGMAMIAGSDPYPASVRPMTSREPSPMTEPPAA